MINLTLEVKFAFEVILFSVNIINFLIKLVKLLTRMDGVILVISDNGMIKVVWLLLIVSKVFLNWLRVNILLLKRYKNKILIFVYILCKKFFLKNNNNNNNNVFYFLIF